MELIVEAIGGSIGKKKGQSVGAPPLHTTTCPLSCLPFGHFSITLSWTFRCGLWPQQNFSKISDTLSARKQIMFVKTFHKQQLAARRDMSAVLYSNFCGHLWWG